MESKVVEEVDSEDKMEDLVGKAVDVDLQAKTIYQNSAYWRQRDSKCLRGGLSTTKTIIIVEPWM